MDGQRQPGLARERGVPELDGTGRAPAEQVGHDGAQADPGEQPGADGARPQLLEEDQPGQPLDVGRGDAVVRQEVPRRQLFEHGRLEWCGRVDLGQIVGQAA